MNQTGSEQQALDFGDLGSRSAVLSPDSKYRYRLDRRWSPGPTVAWIMLNPSTADGTSDEPTLTRITRFSKGWGFGALTVVNLYAWRATDPAELWTAADPVGPANDWHILQAVTGREVVVAWGAHARAERVAEVLKVLAEATGAGRPHALALTKTGQPRHPLYLRADLPLSVWENPNA